MIYVVILIFDDANINKYDSHVFETDFASREFAKLAFSLPYVKQVIMRSIEI